MCYYVLLCVTMCYYVLLCVTMCYYVLLCVTMCYYVLLCVSVRQWCDASSLSCTQGMCLFTIVKMIFMRFIVCKLV